MSNDSLQSSIDSLRIKLMNYRDKNTGPPLEIKRKHKNDVIDEFSHRASCHRCGNLRKKKTLCIRCPYVFCSKCTEKMIEEHGKGVFQDGCPVCKEKCCCGVNKTFDCQRKFHCYKKCPLSKETVTHIASTSIDSLGPQSSDSTSTSLDKLYHTLPKRRKFGACDPFASSLEPKSKKVHLCGPKDLKRFKIYPPSSPLFDESHPFFLLDENLELTEKPLVAHDEVRIDPERRKGKANHGFHSLPKIPSQIRWDQIRKSYEPERISLGMHSFDDIHNETMTFSKLKEWETESLLSDISDFEGHKVDQISPGTGENGVQSALSSTILSGENMAKHDQVDSISQTMVEGVVPPSAPPSDNDSSATDPQILSQGSTIERVRDEDNNGDAVDYLWLEEVADLANNM